LEFAVKINHLTASYSLDCKAVATRRIPDTYKPKPNPYLNTNPNPNPNSTNPSEQVLLNRPLHAGFRIKHLKQMS